MKGTAIGDNQIPFFSRRQRQPSDMTDLSTTPSATQIHPSPAAQITCELSEAGAYSPSYDHPHGPVLAAFAGGPLHEFRIHGRYDLTKVMAKFSAHLFRSVRDFNANKTDIKWDDLTFRMGDKSFVYLDECRIISFTDKADEAERLSRQFHDEGVVPPEPHGGSYRLIRTGRDISTQGVPLSLETILTEQQLLLHYGPGFPQWHQDYLALLRRHRHGLSLLEGPPGTGKTSYLRHLMGDLKDSHRFYFIPNGALSVLTNPEFVGFWADQRRRFEKENFVVILEDSDAALMPRGADNRDQVSSILNLSDGMLADFLRLQIICTINGRATDIDPALMRPGRMLCHRIFDRLPHEHATALATHLGKSLPGLGSYTLAEIFADETPAPSPQRAIGFTV
jgi:hypothetical protein